MGADGNYRFGQLAPGAYKLSAGSGTPIDLNVSVGGTLTHFAAPPVFGFLMGAGLPAMIFWIAVGLYAINAGLVMAIRHNTLPTIVRPAAAAD